MSLQLVLRNGIGEPSVAPAQGFVQADLSEHARTSIAALQIDAGLPWSIVAAESRATLTLEAAHEAAAINRTAAADQEQIRFGGIGHDPQVNLTIGDAVLRVVTGAERGVDRVLAVNLQPSREITLDNTC